MLAGTLSELMNELRAELYETYKIYMFNKLAKIIVDDTMDNPECIINGTAPDLFMGLVKDVLPNIEKMTQYNTKFMVGQSEKPLKSNINDILIFMSTKNASQLKNGIQTQLYNANLLGANGKTLTQENLTVLGNIIEIKGSNETIKDTGKEWIDDSTIIAVDISRIKSVLQITDTETQHFARNNITYLVSHLWGAIDILPWCKKFIYKNPNLSLLPAEEVKANAKEVEKAVKAEFKRQEKAHQEEVKRAKELTESKKKEESK